MPVAITLKDRLISLSRLRELLSFMAYVYQCFIDNNGLENAKSLTYTSLFAVIPLLTLIVSILAIFPAFQSFGIEIQGMILDRLLPSSSSELQAYMTSFSEQARNLTWVGLTMLIVTAYLMLMNIERCFNEIWAVRELRKGLNSFFLYWSVLSLGPFLLVVGFAISSYITSLTLFDAFTDMSGSLGSTIIALQIFPLILTASAFTLLYVAVPNCTVRLWHGFLGGMAVALIFLLVKTIFTWFISLASYELVYGTFAAIPIFLLWLYICWVVILLGANLVKALPAYGLSYRSTKVHPAIISIALLHKLWQLQQHGETLKLKDLNREKWPFHGIPLKDFLEVFIEKRFIKAWGSEEYILARDMGTVSLWQILSSLPWPMPVSDDFEYLPDLIERNLPSTSMLKEKFNNVEELSHKEFSDSVSSLFRTPDKVEGK